MPIFSLAPDTLHIQNYAYLIFVLVSSSSPFLISLLVFCVPLKVLIEEVEKFFASIKKRTIDPLSHVNIEPQKMKSRRIFIFLSLSVLLSIALATIPHIPSINKDNPQIGADTDAYLKFERQLMESNNTSQFFHTAFVKIGDRPISLLFFLGLVKVSGGDILYVTDRLPMVLGPLLVIAIFFLTRELTSNDITSIFAAFLTAVSFHMLVGLYAGFYSNWLALIIGYISIMFLIRYLKKHSKFNLVIFSSALIILLFTHTYTWSIFALVMSIFLGVIAKQNYYRRKNAAILFLVILISVATDFVRVEITGSSGALEADSSIAKSQGASIEQFSERWKNLAETVWTYYGGLTSNFIIFSLAIYWLIIAKKHEIPSILIMTFLSIGILPLLFSGYVIQSRVLYDIPFQIPAAIGISAMRKQSNGPLFVIPICIWLVAISFRAIANLTL